jgi:hypothetical protein
MVTPRLGRRGASTRGCLFSLLIFVAALYYGVNIGEVFYRYYQYRDAMRSAARFAPTLPDDVIVRRVVERADELGLPSKARRVWWCAAPIPARSSSPRSTRNVSSFRCSITPSSSGLARRSSSRLLRVPRARP